MATYIKANNLTNLDVSSSWTTAGVPTSADLAQFTSTFNTAGTLSTTGNLTVGKLQVTNTARNIPLSPSGTFTIDANYPSDSGVAIEVASTYAFICTITSNVVIPTSATFKTGNLNLVLSGSGSKTFSLTGDLTIATAGGASPTMRFSGWDYLNISGSLIVNSGVTVRLEGSDVDRVTVNGTVEAYNTVNLDVLAGNGTIKTNVGSGGTLTFNSFGTFSGSLVSGGSTFGVPFYVGKDDSSSSFGGTISGSGALIKYGIGTLTLSGNNTYYGKTYVGEMTPGAGGGIIDVRSNTALGSGSIEVDQVFTLQNGGSGSVSLSNAINLHDDLTVAVSGGQLTLSGTVTFDGSSGVSVNGGFVNFTGALSGFTPRFEAGTGSAILSCTNSTGDFRLTGGAVRLSGTTALGVGGDLVSLSSGSFGNADASLLTLLFYYITLSGSLDLLGSGPLSFGTSPITLVSDPTLTPYEYDYTIPGVISRPAGLGRLTVGLAVFFTPGKLVFTNTANTFTGGVKLLGTLKVSANGSLGANPGAYDNDNVWFDGGVLECDSNITFNANRGFYLDSGGGAINGTSGFTISGVMNGSGSMLINNTGNNYLNGTNTHTGGTIFLLGDTHLSSDITVGGGDIYLSGGTLYCDSSTTSKLTTSGLFKITGGTLRL